MSRPITARTLRHDWFRSGFFLDLTSHSSRAANAQFFGRDIYERLWFRKLSPPLVQRGEVPTRVLWRGLARERFTMFPDTLLFTLRDSFTDCIETFSVTRIPSGITYHVARVFVHDVVGILCHDREYKNSGHGIDKCDFRLLLTIDICRRQLNFPEEGTRIANVIDKAVQWVILFEYENDILQRYA